MGGVPAWVWVPWIPQLLSGLLRGWEAEFSRRALLAGGAALAATPALAQTSAADPADAIGLAHKAAGQVEQRQAGVAGMLVEQRLVDPLRELVVCRRHVRSPMPAGILTRGFWITAGSSSWIVARSRSHHLLCSK